MAAWAGRDKGGRESPHHPCTGSAAPCSAEQGCEGTAVAPLQVKRGLSASWTRDNADVTGGMKRRFLAVEFRFI